MLGKLGVLVLLYVLGAFSFPSFSRAAEAQTLLRERCALCHKEEEGGKLSRIGYQRKTPEGWLMTLLRMERTQGFRLTPEERNALVRYLSDKQGLAPEEVEDFTYLLERRDWVVEEVSDPRIKAACTRCHSYGRIALERRTPQEWQLLVDFHFGAYPMAEYQSGGRSRDMLAEFRRAAEVLASRFPYETEAWRRWREREPLDPAGVWLVVGYEPGKGAYVGRGKIEKVGGKFRESFSLTYEAGGEVVVEGEAFLYTGFAWRGWGKRGERAVREVLHLTPDGQTMKGRWFYREHEELGGEERRFRRGEAPLLLAVFPGQVDARHKEATLKIFGANFPVPLDPQDVHLGPGLTVEEVAPAGGGVWEVRVRISPDAPLGKRAVEVAGVRAEGLLVVHRGVDYIRVLPEKGLARIGGLTAPKQLQQFEAVGFSKGRDGVLGSEDDVRIGPLPARWSLAEYYHGLGEDDVSYVGSIDQQGLFTPADEGPNPKRPFSTNNVGDVWVEALYQPEPGSPPLSSRAFLIVTVPRWLKPPLR